MKSSVNRMSVCFAGMTIYFAYGIRHSVDDEQSRDTDTDFLIPQDASEVERKETKAQPTTDTETTQ